jgi:DNA-binding winged helix-turn-helix (wHTH) protein
MRDLLAERAVEGLVGRSGELAVLLRMLEEDGPRIVYVHGIGGIGKSALLAAFAARARALGTVVIALDGREFEPSERGFLGAIGAALGDDAPTLESISERLTSGGRVAILIDTVERLQLLDTWLRRAFVPTLGEQVRLVVAGREPPVSAWRTTPGLGPIFRTLSLDSLREAASIELLTQYGVSEEKARSVNDFALGHPLSLVLAASTLAERPDLDLSADAAPRVVAELTRLFLSDIDDPTTRRVLEAACLVRRATVSLLGAMLPDVVPQDAFERLRALPFIEAGAEGLIVHETVQHAVAAELRAADPARSLALRRGAWRRLRAEARASARTEVWRTTADTLYLIENPVVRDAFFPVGGRHYSLEPARSEDGESVLEIAERHDDPAAAARIEGWWAREPGSFSVARDASGATVGFYCMFERDAVSAAALQADPVTREWCRHLHDDPVPKGQRVLFIRRWLASEYGESPSPVQAACWLDIKRTYMELRPHLRRVYLLLREVEPFADAALALGIRVVESAEVKLGSERYTSAMLDFGPGSVDGWIAGMVDAVLGSADDELLDAGARELVLEGERVPLTRLEFEVVRYLRDRADRAVRRADLLHDVWGSAYEGDSNVVDVVIRGVRRKLGVHADRIETLRGIGYRLRADSGGLATRTAARLRVAGSRPPRG